MGLCDKTQGHFLFSLSTVKSRFEIKVGNSEPDRISLAIFGYLDVTDFILSSFVYFFVIIVFYFLKFVM